MVKSNRLLTGVCGLLAFSLLVGCGNQEEVGKTGGVEQVQQEQAANRVNVAKAEEGVLANQDRLMGEVMANTSVVLLPKAAGTLVELSVKKGDSVQKGQVIGKLDPEDYVLGVKQAQAALGVAVARLNQAKSSNTADVAGPSYELAERAYQLANASYERMKALVASNAASKSQLEEEEAALIQAKNALNSAAKGDAQSTASVAIEQAAVRGAEVGVEKAQSALRDTQIKATATGVITDVMVEVGEFVSSQTSIASLINIDPLLVRLNVSENNLGKFKNGTEMEVAIPSQGKKLMGKVSFVGLEAAAQTKLFPIELEVANPDRVILPGMKVEVFVKDLQAKSGILIPTDALVEEQGHQYVYVVNGNTAGKREVVLGEGNTEEVIVESGLQAGEQIVIEGHSQLKDQAIVSIVEK